MDQNSAYINVEWIGKTLDTNQHTFQHEELRMLPLKYGDSIQVLQRALTNIYDYAVDDLLKLILDALDEYRNKIKEKGNADSMEEPQTEAEPRAPPSPPLPPRSKRARGAAAMGQTATQSFSVVSLLEINGRNRICLDILKCTFRQPLSQYIVMDMAEYFLSLNIRSFKIGM
jgi:hypothetical protein